MCNHWLIKVRACDTDMDTDGLLLCHGFYCVMATGTNIPDSKTTAESTDSGPIKAREEGPQCYLAVWCNSSHATMKLHICTP